MDWGFRANRHFHVPRGGAQYGFPIASIRKSYWPARGDKGLRVQGIAADQGSRKHSVRWLLKRVYRKLGISGQVALVRQVLAADAMARG